MVTSFHALSEKFVTQYMCSIKRKQSVISLFHVRMGRSESIGDFMKCFRATQNSHQEDDLSKGEIVHQLPMTSIVCTSKTTTVGDVRVRKTQGKSK